MHGKDNPPPTGGSKIGSGFTGASPRSRGGLNVSLQNTAEEHAPVSTAAGIHSLVGCPDTKTIADFLRMLRPEGPWLLMAIHPEGKHGRPVKTFRDLSKAVKWAADLNATHSVYFHVNPVRGDVADNHKAKKIDIASVEYLHVDVDPRAGEDRITERQRILNKIRSYSLKPSAVLDSGNGYQCLWRLNRGPETKLDGTEERADKLGLYNKQLAQDLDGDCTQDVSRILRLPGTVNRPNPKKRKANRQNEPALLIEFEPTLVYDLSEFTPAKESINGTATTSRTASQHIPLGVGKPVGTEQLQAWAEANGKTMEDHTLALIATGAHPTDPQHYPSRSEALFRVVCDLVRAEVPDEMIFGAITDPDNTISASVREQRDWQGYARRQIERAREKRRTPTLPK